MKANNIIQPQKHFLCNLLTDVLLTDVTSKGLDHVTWHGLTLGPIIRFHCIRRTAICSSDEIPCNYILFRHLALSKEHSIQTNCFMTFRCLFFMCPRSVQPLLAFKLSRIFFYTYIFNSKATKYLLLLLPRLLLHGYLISQLATAKLTLGQWIF